MAPLDGIHVIDLSLLLPGPLATQILRDLGARVTKVEPLAWPGDYMALLRAADGRATSRRPMRP